MQCIQFIEATEPTEKKIIVMYNRAYINTYISLIAATVCTFIASAIFGTGRRFQAVDVQNATLAGAHISLQGDKKVHIDILAIALKSISTFIFYFKAK